MQRNRLQIAAMSATVLVGVALRLRQFVTARSLWNDEVALARSFVQRGFPDILLEPLLLQQSAPPGYLLATQSAVRVLGTSEQALRLTALLAGLATLGLAVFVAYRLLTNPLARLLFVALIALSPTLIYYANEIKQYSSDALAVMAVLALWALRNDRRAVWWWGIGGALIAISSLTGIIGLVGLGAAAALEQYQQRSGEGAEPPTAWSPKIWIRVVGPWAAAVALHGLYTLRAGTDREFMNRWWGERGAFPPEAVESFGDLGWYPLALMRLVWVGIGESERVGPRAGTGPLLVTVIAAVLVFAALRRRRDLRALFGVTLAGAWVLAELRIYPTSGRLSLYLIPLIFLMLAAGFEQLIASREVVTRLASGAGAALLLFIQASLSGPQFTEPLDDRDMQWVATELEARATSDDVIIAAPRFSEKIARWYGLAQLVAPGNFLSAPAAEQLPEAVRAGVPRRLWVTSTHSIGDAQALVSALADGAYADICQYNTDGTFLALLVREDLAPALDTDAVCAFTTSR